MIVDIATEERVPVNEIKDLPLGKLGNLICDESIKGNTDYVEELVTQFLEIVRDDLKDEDIQIYRHQLLTDPSGCNSIPRLIIHTRLDNVGEAKKTLKNLRDEGLSCDMCDMDSWKNKAKAYCFSAIKKQPKKKSADVWGFSAPITAQKNNKDGSVWNRI